MTSDYPIEIYLQHHDGCGVYINRKCDCGCAEAAAELEELKRDYEERGDEIISCVRVKAKLRAELDNKRKVMELLGYILGEDGDLVDNAQHLRAELDEARKVIGQLRADLLMTGDEYSRPNVENADTFLKAHPERK